MARDQQRLPMGALESSQQSGQHSLQVLPSLAQDSVQLLRSEAPESAESSDRLRAGFRQLSGQFGASGALLGLPLELSHPVAGSSEGASHQARWSTRPRRSARRQTESEHAQTGDRLL